MGPQLLAAIVFPGNQLPVPSQKRFGRDNCCNLSKDPSADTVPDSWMVGLLSSVIARMGPSGYPRMIRAHHWKFSTSIRLRAPGRLCVYKIERVSLFGPGDTARTQPGSPISAMRLIFPVEKLRN
jgi:hypothetical protein